MESIKSSIGGVKSATTPQTLSIHTANALSELVDEVERLRAEVTELRRELDERTAAASPST